MAEHKIIQNNIVYIIPDDDLFERYKRNEAYIDEYGRLINCKPHRVLRELKHYAKQEQVVRQRVTNSPAQPVRKNSPVIDHFKKTAQDKVTEVGEHYINQGIEKIFYEIVPYFWIRHVRPFSTA